ncbi:KAD1 kinase, partial [Polypterus senegalus]|nr:KAD1 kinase [Polypterus senegalus]
MTWRKLQMRLYVIFKTIGSYCQYKERKREKLGYTIYTPSFTNGPRCPVEQQQVTMKTRNAGITSLEEQFRAAQVQAFNPRMFWLFKTAGNPEELVPGGPGSGKGTQCEKIAEKYGFTHLSCGDIIRNELLSDSERGNLIKDFMERGEHVPMETVLELMREAMVTNLESTKGFLIDGYPRDLRQGEGFEMKIAEPSLVLYLDCSADTMTKRIQKRIQGMPCYDDSQDTIRKRVDAFYQTIEVITAGYERRKLLKTVSLSKSAMRCLSPESGLTSFVDLLNTRRLLVRSLL